MKTIDAWDGQRFAMFFQGRHSETPRPNKKTPEERAKHRKLEEAKDAINNPVLDDTKDVWDEDE